jgi:hypothetical protein
MAYFREEAENNHVEEASDRLLEVHNRFIEFQDSVGVSYEEYTERLEQEIQNDTTAYDEVIEPVREIIRNSIEQSERSIILNRNSTLTNIINFFNWIQSYGIYGYGGTLLAGGVSIYAGYWLYRRINATPPVATTTPNNVNIVDGVEVVKVPNMLERIWKVLTTKFKTKK